MAWAGPLSSTTWVVVATFVLIATGFVATWRVRRGIGSRHAKSAATGSSRQSPRHGIWSAGAQSNERREPFLSEANDIPSRRLVRMAPPGSSRMARSRSHPADIADAPSAASALYIGSVNLTPAPSPQQMAVGRAMASSSAKRPPIELRSTQSLAEDFMQWLSEGLATRMLPVNTSQAAVHFLEAGMVLVYPTIFQAYASSCATPTLPGPAPSDKSLDRSQAVLDAICDLGWHERGPFDSRLLHFELLQHRAEPSILKGLIIQAPHRFLQSLPAANPSLSRLI